jgi:DNA gyrase subunit B
VERISNRETLFLGNGEKVAGKTLAGLLKSLIRFYENVTKLSRMGYSSRFIEFMVLEGKADRRLYKDPDFVEDLKEKLCQKKFRVQDLPRDEERGNYELLVTETLNGGQTFIVNWEFLSSPELRYLVSMSEKLKTLSKGGCRLVEEQESRVMGNPQDVLGELLDRGKKGLTIQRYKGLGEMNPGQLWQTTMDPERRTLLKVEIEDVVEADDIFTVLMGDKVEPRREFIQNNALQVKELDI